MEVLQCTPDFNIRADPPVVEEAVMAAAMIKRRKR